MPKLQDSIIPLWDRANKTSYVKMTSEDLYRRLLVEYAMMCGEYAKMFLGKKINAYVKQGFSREEAIRKVAEDEKLYERL